MYKRQVLLVLVLGGLMQINIIITLFCQLVQALNWLIIAVFLIMRLKGLTDQRFTQRLYRPFWGLKTFLVIWAVGGVVNLLVKKRMVAVICILYLVYIRRIV